MCLWKIIVIHVHVCGPMIVLYERTTITCILFPCNQLSCNSIVANIFVVFTSLQRCCNHVGFPGNIATMSVGWCVLSFGQACASLRPLYRHFITVSQRNCATTDANVACHSLMKLLQTLLKK